MKQDLRFRGRADRDISKKKAGKEEYSKQMETERKRSTSEPDRDRQKQNRLIQMFF